MDKLKSLNWALVAAGSLYWCQTNLVYTLQTLDGLAVSTQGVSAWALTLLGNLVSLFVLAVGFGRNRSFGPRGLAVLSCAVILLSLSMLWGVYAGLVDGRLLWVGVFSGGVGEGMVLVLLAKFFAQLAPRQVLLTTGVQQLAGAALFFGLASSSPEIAFVGAAVAVFVQTGLFVRVERVEAECAEDRPIDLPLEESAAPWLAPQDARPVLALASLAVGLCYGAVIALVMAVATPLTFGAAGSAAPALGASDPAVMAASALVGGALLAASALLPRRNPEGYLFQIAAPLLAVGLASIPLLVRNVPLALPLLLSCSTYFFGILWYFVSLADDGSALRAGKVAASSFFAFLLGHLVARFLVEFGPSPFRDASLVSIALFLMMVFLLLAYISRYKQYEQSLVQRAEQREFELACETVALRYGLTEREASVFRLLALGFTAKKIAEKLIVSENTAKTHVRHVYAKLEIHSRDELNQIVDSLTR